MSVPRRSRTSVQTTYLRDDSPPVGAVASRRGGAAIQNYTFESSPDGRLTKMRGKVTQSTELILKPEYYDYFRRDGRDTKWFKQIKEGENIAIFNWREANTQSKIAKEYWMYPDSYEQKMKAGVIYRCLRHHELDLQLTKSEIIGEVKQHKKVAKRLKEDRAWKIEKQKSRARITELKQRLERQHRQLGL